MKPPFLLLALALLAGPCATWSSDVKPAASWDFLGIHTSLVGPADAVRHYFSEGSTVLLKDGRLMHVMTTRRAPLAGQKEGWHPHYVPTELSRAFSADRGRTWSEGEFMLKTEVRTTSLPALARLGDGALGLSYNKIAADTKAVRVFRRSTDEGASWSDEIAITPTDAYWTASHDRTLVLADGRIVQPLHHKEVLLPERMVTHVALSDDHGRTWRVGSQRLNVEDRMPAFVAKTGKSRGTGFWEVAVAPRADGSLLMVGRTRAGLVYRSVSADRGETWSQPEATAVASPEAPANIERIPGTGDLLLVWSGGYVNPDNPWLGHRTTLSTAISTDGGLTWKWRRDLASATPDTTGGYGVTYPSILFHDGAALIGYHHMTGRNETQRGREYLARVPLAWLYAERDEHRPEHLGTARRMPD
jgi:sialidase-1